MIQLVPIFFKQKRACVGKKGNFRERANYLDKITVIVLPEWEPNSLKATKIPVGFSKFSQESIS